MRFRLIFLFGIFACWPVARAQFLPGSGMAQYCPYPMQMGRNAYDPAHDNKLRAEVLREKARLQGAKIDREIAILNKQIDRDEAVLNNRLWGTVVSVIDEHMRTRNGSGGIEVNCQPVAAPSSTGDSQGTDAVPDNQGKDDPLFGTDNRKISQGRRPADDGKDPVFGGDSQESQSTSAPIAPPGAEEVSEDGSHPSSTESGDSGRNSDSKERRSHRNEQASGSSGEESESLATDAGGPQDQWRPNGSYGVAPQEKWRPGRVGSPRARSLCSAEGMNEWADYAEDAGQVDPRVCEDNYEHIQLPGPTPATVKACKDALVRMRDFFGQIAMLEQEKTQIVADAEVARTEAALECDGGQCGHTVAQGTQGRLGQLMIMLRTMQAARRGFAPPGYPMPTYSPMGNMMYGAPGMGMTVYNGGYGMAPGALATGQFGCNGVNNPNLFGPPQWAMPQGFPQYGSGLGPGWGMPQAPGYFTGPATMPATAGGPYRPVAGGWPGAGMPQGYGGGPGMPFGRPGGMGGPPPRLLPAMTGGYGGGGYNGGYAPGGPAVAPSVLGGQVNYMGGQLANWGTGGFAQPVSPTFVVAPGGGGGGFSNAVYGGASTGAGYFGSSATLGPSLSLPSIGSSYIPGAGSHFGPPVEPIGPY